MKIIYSPQYDGEIFLGDRPTVMGAKYVGTLGLLEELGLRTGIRNQPLSDVEREASYHNAMQKHIKGTLFENAASVDPLGVAAKLLRWRDSLIMAGWDGTVPADRNDLPKLAVLAAIERDFKALGTADQWRKVYSACQNGLPAGNTKIEVQIDCPWSEIPTLVQRTLAAIGAKEPSATARQTTDASKFKMLEFKDVNDAYEWIAQVKNLPSNTVVVNRDNVRLNHTLYTWDKPAVRSSQTQSNPQLLQLFKLSMSVFARPFNLQNLVSYLRLPLNPIPSKLRYVLAYLLTKNGGFGEKKLREEGNASGKELDDWDNEIENFAFLNKDRKTTPQAKSKKMVFLRAIRTPYPNGIPKTDLTDYIGALKTWLNGFRSLKDLPEAYTRQLHELSLMFSSLETATKDMGEVIQYADIEKLVMQIYRPMNYTRQQTQNKSMNVITDIRSMARPANTLIWLDCQAEDIESDPYDFLNHNERDYLRSAGADIPDFQLHLKSIRNERTRLLNAVQEQVILVKSLYDGATRLGEHSFVAELRHNSKGVLQTASPDTLFDMTETETENGEIDQFHSEFYYNIGEINYPGRQESNSSIDELIHFPFNYVMDYVADLPLPADEQLKNIRLTLGLVAHYFFQKIIENGGNDLAKMERLVNDEFAPRLEEAIDTCGLILRQPENASQRNIFEWQLKESILSLIKIMRYLHLTPVGCEILFPKDKKNPLSLDGIGKFEARIDFLLTNEEGKYVIFDFKWSSGKTYPKKLEDNNALQLELYRQTILATYPGKEVAGIGYYLMPLKTLYTYDFDEIPGTTLIHKEKRIDDNLFERIKASFQVRMEEILKGKIEEAELMDMRNITDCYFAKQDEKGLCPLEVDKINEDRVLIAIRKSSEYVYRPVKKNNWDDNDKEPSEIATSHSILKGRLK